MNKDLSMRAFTSVAEAIDYLNAVKLMLRNGELDYIVQEYIDMLRLRAQLARETAKETDNSLSGDPIVRETVITPAANLKVVK
jgi:DNA-directed RNA polymerase subunit F